MNMNRHDAREDTVPAGAGSTWVSMSDVVQNAISRWKQGDAASVRQVVDSHPDLLRHESLLFDLVLADFECRRAAGEQLGPLTYREQFDSFGASLAASIERLVAVEVAIGDCRAKPRLNWPQLGDDIGQFHIVDELGRGSFSRVFECTERTVGDRRVAVKITRQITPEPEQLGKLNHPNIVPILSVTQDETLDATLIAMPLFGKRTLEDLVILVRDIQHGQRHSLVHKWLTEYGSFGARSDDVFSWKKTDGYSSFVFQLGAEICAGLAHAHEQRVIHCDVKPSNILLSHGCRPLLIDFNLSCPTIEGHRLLGGTREYMPPEFWQLINGKRKDFDRHDAVSPAADVFSLAITLAEAIVGDRPLSSTRDGDEVDDPAQAYEKQCALVESAIESCRPTKRVAETWRRCLKHRALERPSAVEFCTALATEGRREARRRRIHRRVVLSTGAGLLAAASGLGVVSVLRPNRRQMILDVRSKLDDHRHEDALTILAEIVRRFGEFDETIYLRAHAWLSVDDFDRAFEEYKQLFPRIESPILEAEVAYCMARQGEYSWAINRYEHALETMPPDYSCANNLACCYWLGRNSTPSSGNLQDTDQLADKWFEDAISIDDRPWQARVNQVRFFISLLLRNKRTDTPQTVVDRQRAHQAADRLRATHDSAAAKLSAAVLLAHVDRPEQGLNETSAELMRQVIQAGEAPSGDGMRRHLAYFPFVPASERLEDTSSLFQVAPQLGPIWVEPPISTRFVGN